MKHKVLAAIAAAALLLMTIAPVGTGAASPTRGFHRLDLAKIDRDVLAKVLAKRDVDVIVELRGQGASARGLSNANQKAVAKQLRSAQDKLDGSIRKLGGRVDAKYQYAFNGIKLHVPSRQLAALSRLPGVVGVQSVPTYKVDNTRSVAYIASHSVWQDYGDTGQGQTIAIIDTGIDYTHANFGGPGTEAAYDDNDSDVIESGSFPTAKVVGGWDFVGDDYDPESDGPEATPSPDPDPLDCNGHGSHVAGSAAGFGVKSDHTTYTGAYNKSTYATSFGIGPGVAPKAKLIALKVFGCDGGTNVLTDALEWVAVYNATHADGIDVVNMSIGGIGGDYTADAQASNALVSSGVSVVASAGNEGPNAYMTGAPGNATGVLSVAASDVIASYPGALVDRATGTDVNGINENNYPGLPVGGTLRPIVDDGATADVDEHLGCTEADYGDLPANSIAVIQRGVCTFVEKGAAAEAAGAVGVIVVNRDDIVDPNEPPTFIGYTPLEFDIPMIGVGRSAKAGLFAADGVAATLKSGPAIPNPDYLANADFSSAGPRLGDSANKPDITAPGVNIVSTAVGLGYKGTTLSGTSMASPHVAGVAALVRQRHPTWSAYAVKAVIVGSAVQSKVSPYNPVLAGSGMVQPRRAVDGLSYVLAHDGTPSLSFGYDQRSNGIYNETLTFELYNTGSRSETYTLASTGIVRPNVRTITVAARSHRTIRATASLSAAQLAASRSASQTAPGGTDWGGLVSYGGVITITPTVHTTGHYPVRMTYRAVPRAESNIVPRALTSFASAGGTSSATYQLRNSGAHYGYADVYAWGLSDPKDMPSAITATNDIRAVGLQVLPAEALTGEVDPDDRGLIFAINTYGRWSGGFQNVFQIDIYGDGPDPEFSVISIDLGILTAGDFSGQVVSLIVDADGNPVDSWVADAPANGSTILLPLLASDIDRTDPGATIDYEVFGDTFVDSADPGDSLEDVVEGRASLSVFDPAVSSGDFLKVDRSRNVLLSVDEAAQAENPSKGWMIVTLDDPNGAAQADVIPAPALP
jgi:subtilisin family serine protease